MTLYHTLMMKYDNNKIIKTNDFLIAEGDIPIALIAHLDTVFVYHPEEIYYDPKARVMWSPQGLGADDRAGVYAIVKLLKLGYKPHIIFTTEEEMGCIGSQKMITQLSTMPFDILKYIIQLDRRGIKDSVFYDCDNKDFEKYINNFGFKTAFGTFSDISYIAPSWGVAAVNLSVGYEDEHQEIERLFVNSLQRTIKKVAKMLDDADNAYSFAYIPSKSNRFLMGGKTWISHPGICDWCGNQIVGTNNPFKLCKACWDVYQKYDIK